MFITPTNPKNDADQRAIVEAISRAATYATQHGVVVASAGNEVYSNFGSSAVDVTAPGGSSGQAPNPFGRVLNAWSRGSASQHGAPPAGGGLRHDRW